ncbi:MAG TPA: hypothetical protein VEM59_06315 [Acidimicrobiia bacterium]|nr:hypothetical protein [Acidimicrobiia bacterium]
MSRRLRRIIQVSAVVVIVASLVVARVLSIESDRVGVLGVAQAGLFVAFAIAALTLFATVVMDFDRWVDTVPPVPKRPVRRWVGRNARRISRLLALVLAWYGAVMSWVWSTTGEALGWVLSRWVAGVSSLSVWLARAGTRVFSAYRVGAHRVWSFVGRGLVWVLALVGEGLTWLWVSAVQVGAWVLVRYRAGAHWLWLSTGRGFVWVLARVGEGLTWLWVSAVQVGAWVLVRYRAGARWLWLSAGRGFVWVLARVGEGLTWLWVWLVRAGGSGWAAFRAGMRWLWLSAGRGFAWVLARVGEGLTWLWVWLVRASSSLIVRLGAAVSQRWRAAFGRERVTTSTPRRPWYSSAVDSVLGIPPEGAPLDPVTRRRATRPRPANRPRPLRRPTYGDHAETISSRNATRTTSDSGLTSDSRARYVGRQITRRGERRKSEELLADALARFRSARSQPHEREEDREDP